MLWEAATLCFFGFLRSGEITIPNNSNYDPSAHLNFSDISVDNSAMPSIIQVRIKASKTDPFRQGVNIHMGVLEMNYAQLLLFLCIWLLVAMPLASYSILRMVLH